MSALGSVLDELVTANRILAREGVVDSFGHVSVRHLDRTDRYFLSRARAPECIELDDLMEFGLDGTAIDPRGRTPYAERFIHGAIYEARPGVRAVVHHHSPSVIPFSVTSVPLSPIMHMCAGIGARVSTWDSRTSFGDTNLLVTTVDMGRNLAAALGDGPVILIQLNADLQMKARALGDITFLTEGEVAAVLTTRTSFTFERAWERWCRRAGRPYDVRPIDGPLAGRSSG